VKAKIRTNVVTGYIVSTSTSNINLRLPFVYFLLHLLMVTCCLGAISSNTRS